MTPNRVPTIAEAIVLLIIAAIMVLGFIGFCGLFPQQRRERRKSANFIKQLKDDGLL